MGELLRRILRLRKRLERLRTTRLGFFLTFRGRLLFFLTGFLVGCAADTLSVGSGGIALSGGEETASFVLVSGMVLVFGDEPLVLVSGVFVFSGRAAATDASLCCVVLVVGCVGCGQKNHDSPMTMTKSKPTPMRGCVRKDSPGRCFFSSMASFLATFCIVGLLAATFSTIV